MILRCLMYPLVVVDTTFLRDPEVGHKMAMAISMSKSSD